MYEHAELPKKNGRERGKKERNKHCNEEPTNKVRGGGADRCKEGWAVGNKLYHIKIVINFMLITIRLIRTFLLDMD